MVSLEFRMWDKVAKAMFQPEQFAIAGNGLIVFAFNDLMMPRQDTNGFCGYEKVNDKNIYDLILMQYIGLKDKNGKKIYEGDIIRSIETDEVYQIDEMLPAHRHDHSTNIGYFSFDGKYETRDNPASRYTGDDWMSWPEMYEVIGNIHQNPEYLKS